MHTLKKMEKKRILIVEDDITLCNGIELALRTNDYEFCKVFCLREAMRIPLNELDLIILDINLPDGNGLSFLRQIRETSDIPVILLTANDMEMDIVTGLEMGADDYITKPFSLAILRARVRTRLRKEVQPEHSLITIGDYEFDFTKMIFKKENQLVELSKTEQKLLRYLVSNKGQVISRAELVDRIWTDGADYVDENALSVTIKRLRNKLENIPSKPKYIKTIYGIGYTWAVDKNE